MCTMVRMDNDPAIPPPGAATQPVSPAQVGSKLLSKFADTDALILRAAPSAPPPTAPPAIPLKRFQELEQAIRNAPANPDPYVELGRIYLDQKRWADAKRVLETGAQHCPECEPLALMREDLALLLASQFVDEAKRRHAEQHSEQSQYDLEQADINLANERIRICTSRFARRPTEKEILIPWAIALRQLGRHEEAVGLLTDAALDPGLRARASLQLGMCYQTLQRPLDALAALRKACLYRSPPPDPAVRIRALELAVMIAEQNQLIDSARYYAGLLLAAVDADRKGEVAGLVKGLEEKEL
jgi:tetratricopeptide (TPR) repeat protein